MTHFRKSLFKPSGDEATSSGNSGGLHDLVSAGETAAAAVGEPGRSLTSSLTIAFFVTASLLAISASGILYWATVATLQYADDQVVDKRAGTVIEILQAKELNDGLLAHEVNEDNQGPRQIFMRVVSRHPPIQLETEKMSGLLAPEVFPDAKASDRFVPVRATIKSKDGKSYRAASFRVPITALPGEDAILQVATDTSLNDESLSLFKKILLTVVGVALPLSALLSWYVVNRSLRPLERIAAATQRMDGGKLDQRLALNGLPSELHELGVHFNSMLGRLESTWSDLRHYADTIAHEMRTPLNRMRLDCEIALDNANTLDEFRAVIGSSVTECERMTKLLQGLLFLARVEGKQATLAKSRNSLGIHLATLNDYFEAEAIEKGVNFSASRATGLYINGDPQLLQQAIGNLISNAIAHTPAGGIVSVKAERCGNEIGITVEDTGEGIASEYQPHIFDRFYRAGRAASGAKNSEHLGLGLSIAKGIVELHGGHITLASELGRGTKVKIMLPAATHALD